MRLVEMLIDFTVTNFRSIRDEQTLSFYAEQPGSHLTDNIRYPVNNIGVLSTAAIYGPNAAGKSNIILALKALYWLIDNSHLFKEGANISTYEPYKLANETLTAPVCFELEFIVDGTRYLYSISYNQNEVSHESLRYYSVGAQRTTLALLFERVQGDDWNSMSFGGHFKGGTRKIPFFKNQAYLSKAGNTPDAPDFIRKVYQFFSKGTYFIKQGNIKLDPMWKANTELVQEVAKFLHALDDGISNIHIKKRDIDELNIQFPQGMSEETKKTILTDNTHEVYFERQTKSGYKTLLSLEEESDGIRSLLNSMPLVIAIISQGSILIWDELETSLHPHVAELVLNLFNDPEINKNNAQLVFTTHNLALMNSSKMRKDQLWLVEKQDGASELVSLDEFESSQLKHTSPFAKWYYDGRLGGLPAIDYAAIKRLFKVMDYEVINGETT